MSTSNTKLFTVTGRCLPQPQQQALPVLVRPEVQSMIDASRKEDAQTLRSFMWTDLEQRAIAARAQETHL